MRVPARSASIPEFPVERDSGPLMRRRGPLPWLSRKPEESQVESSEYQDDADIRHQSFPESVSEERDIHTDYNGCHHHSVKHASYLSVHFSALRLSRLSPHP